MMVRLPATCPPTLLTHCRTFRVLGCSPAKQMITNTLVYAALLLVALIISHFRMPLGDARSQRVGRSSDERSNCSCALLLSQAEGY